jgi:hypothetical protein
LPVDQGLQFWWDQPTSFTEKLASLVQKMEVTSCEWCQCHLWCKLPNDWTAITCWFVAFFKCCECPL